MKYSIERTKTGSGKTRFKLRMVIGRGKDAKKRTLHFATKEEAKDAADREILKIAEEEKAKAELRRLGISEADIRTWDTELKYYSEHALPTFSPGWQETIRSFEDELTPLLSGKLVYTQINHETLDSVVAHLRKARPLMKKDDDGNLIVVRTRRPDSDKTIWLKIGWIQSVLNFSVKKRRLKYSPIADFEKRKPAEPEIEFWEQFEADEFLRFADKKYPPGSERRWQYVAYLTCLNCALRAGELYAIKPSSMKRSVEQLYISEQVNKVTKEFTTLKGREARMVPMNADVMTELDEQIRRRKLKSDDLIFSHDGGPIDHKNFYSQFHRDQAEWGGRSISVHGLRHTGATLMLIAGIDVRTLQKIMGHKDIKTTERYLHLVSKTITEAGRKFSARTRKKTDASE